MDNRVFIAKCDDYERERVNEAVRRVLDAFGGAEAILNGGKQVIVKPNLIMPRKPEDAATTHPVVMEAVCAAFVEAGAEVAIIDSTGGPHTKLVLKLLYGKTGMKQAAVNSGAKVSFDTSVKTVTNPEARIHNKMELLAPVLDADLVISTAKAKTHGFMAMTGCVKNLFGCIPGMGKPMLHRKYSGHEDFAGMLVDICQTVKPGFSILDGVYGMEGAGPTAGSPKHLGLIAGGVSPYAVDLAQCYLMGLRTGSIETITEAASRGLAPDTPEKLTWLGDDHEPMRKSFIPAVRHKKGKVPEIMDNCTGCGECARVCPMKCIMIQEKKAAINGKECIRCYCCHEFCPEKTISLD